MNEWEQFINRIKYQLGLLRSLYVSVKFMMRPKSASGVYVENSIGGGTFLFAASYWAAGKDSGYYEDPCLDAL